MKYLLNTNAVSGVFAIIVALVSKMKQGQLTARGAHQPPRLAGRSPGGLVPDPGPPE